MEETTPFGVIQGPKVMLANEYSGSGGDLLPWMFKRKKIGPVVGKRTWGGLVGIGGYPTLIDGGVLWISGMIQIHSPLQHPAARLALF